MIREILFHERRTNCNGIKCPQIAQYEILGKSKSLKFCSFHIEELIKSFCKYGFARRAAKSVIDNPTKWVGYTPEENS